MDATTSRASAPRSTDPTPAAPAGTATSPPAAERAYAHVKRAVLEREYEGGTLLTEGELADEVGVSRTPVREALLRLQAEGLLRLYPKRGALVLPVSAAELDDVVEARALVESFTARKALAHRATLADTLGGHLDEMRTRRDAADPRGFMEADRAFHAAVVAAAGNSVLTRVYDGLRDRQLCAGVAAMRHTPAWMDQVVEEHTAILDALRAGDDARFTALVDAHVESVGARLRSMR
jgi:DNA-binding GntR family transcriptional regulator